MKKHIKILSFCFIIGLTFFVGNMNKVFGYSDKGTVYKCEYSANNAEASFEYYFNQDVDKPVSKKIHMGLIDGKDRNHDDDDKTPDSPEIYLTRGVCPPYMAIIWKTGNYNAATGSEMVVDQYIKQYVTNGDWKTSYKLKLKASSDPNKYLNMLSSINNYNTKQGFYKVKAGASYMNMAEQRYSCTYNKNGSSPLVLEFYDRFAYYRETYNGNDSGFKPTEIQNNNPRKLPKSYDNACPANVFEITYDSKKGYRYGALADREPHVLTGFDGDNTRWPEICSKKGVSCKMYSSDSVREFTEYVPPKNVSLSGQYFKKKMFGVDETNILNFSLMGNDQGSLKGVNLEVNSQTAYIAVAKNYPDLLDTLLHSILVGGNESNLPLEFKCDSRAVMEKNGFIGKYYDANKSGWSEPDASFTGLYCTFSGLGYEDKFLEELSNHTGFYTKNSQSAGYNAGNIEEFLDKIDDEYNAKCLGKLESVECKNWQEEQYDKLVLYTKNCKQIFANLSLSDTSGDVKKCIELNQSIEQWSDPNFDKDYFGGRVIKGTSGTGCKETLGALGSWLSRIYKILLLAVPVIIVAFGIKDFVQAQVSGKEDELKKMISIFIKRLIFGAFFIALPILIKVILTLALGSDLADMCIF